jgi:hypothetical protein
MDRFYLVFGYTDSCKRVLRKEEGGREGLYTVVQNGWLILLRDTLSGAGGWGSSNKSFHSCVSCDMIVGFSGSKDLYTRKQGVPSVDEL